MHFRTKIYIQISTGATAKNSPFSLSRAGIDKSCRSVNFRKMSVNDGTGNCQLLNGVDSENPELLHKDEHFDYYILLQPNRASISRAKCRHNNDIYCKL